MNRTLLAVAVVAIALALITSALYLSTTKKATSITISFCDKIATPDMRTICLGIFSNDPSTCRNTGNFDEYCYDSIFGKMRNISSSLCAGMPSYYSKSKCYYELAKQTSNPVFCDDAGGMYQQCSWDLALATDNSDLCGRIQVDCERNQCLAVVKGNVSICGDVPDSPEKVTCVAKLSKNMSIETCKDYAPDRASINYIADCVKSVVMSTRNISLCDLIGTQDAKIQCLVGISQSIDICNSQSEHFWKDYCMIEYIKTISIKND